MKTIILTMQVDDDLDIFAVAGDVTDALDQWTPDHDNDDRVVLYEAADNFVSEHLRTCGNGEPDGLAVSGTITRNGITTHWQINDDGSYSQWGGTNAELGANVDLLSAIGTTVADTEF